MAVIHEEKTHAGSGATVTVSQREKGESREPWQIISLNVERRGPFTPRELQALGKWLVENAKRIAREYKASGAPRNGRRE